MNDRSEKCSLSAAKKFWIYTTKQDSALLYHLLEAHEGIAAYSTVDDDVVCQSIDSLSDKTFKEKNWIHKNRVVELIIPVHFVEDVKTLIADWSAWVHYWPEN